MKVGHEEDGGTHLKLWRQVQTSDVLCHPQSHVLANHFFLPHLDGMEALIALAAGKAWSSLEAAGREQICSKSKHKYQNATLSDSSINMIIK